MIERTASSETAPESKKRNDGFEPGRKDRTPGERKDNPKNERIWERKLFYRLTRALMGDPFTISVILYTESVASAFFVTLRPFLHFVIAYQRCGTSFRVPFFHFRICQAIARC
ncbi:MAG: hypothetical protein JWR26_1753 [Pedosphaera sp.]|nr:hypothetical protein [Pedosphaera sp.]